MFMPTYPSCYASPTTLNVSPGINDFFSTTANMMPTTLTYNHNAADINSMNSAMLNGYGIDATNYNLNTATNPAYNNFGNVDFSALSNGMVVGDTTRTAAAAAAMFEQWSSATPNSSMSFPTMSCPSQFAVPNYRLNSDGKLETTPHMDMSATSSLIGSTQTSTLIKQELTTATAVGDNSNPNINNVCGKDFSLAAQLSAMYRNGTSNGLCNSPNNFSAHNTNVGLRLFSQQTRPNPPYKIGPGSNSEPRAEKPNAEERIRNLFKIGSLIKEGQTATVDANTSGASSAGGKSLFNNARWKIILILLLLLIAILLASAIVFLLRDNVDRTNSDYSDPLNSNNSYFSSAKPNVDEVVQTTSYTRAIETTPPSIEEIALPSNTHHSYCQIVTDSTDCPSISQPNTQQLNSIVDDLHSLSNILHSVQATEYVLNISIQDRNDHHLNGAVEFQVEALKDTNIVAVYASRHIVLINKKQIFVRKCSSDDSSEEEGEPICIEWIARVVSHELLLIKFTQKITAGTIIRLRVNEFQTQLSLDNGGLVLQQPLKWERDRAWIVGTFNGQPQSQQQLLNSPAANNGKNDLLHSVFPQITSGNNDKAVLKLCLEHPKDATARSNMPKRIVTEGVKTTTCFYETPQISVENFAFVIFDNLRSITSDPESSYNVEVFVGKHLVPQNSQWIIDETIQTLNKVGVMTQAKFPLEKLTLVSSPLSSNDGTATLGLIHIKETWLDYPKFFFTHNVLVAQIVRQWASNLVAFCDRCFQDGLVTYIEWLVSAELNSKVAATTEGDSSGNVTYRFLEVRNRLMQSGSTATNLFATGLKPVNDCADRIAVILFMLQNTYSLQTIHRFFSLALRQNAWHDQCVSNAQLSKLFRESSDNSQIAQQVFDSFVNQNQTENETKFVPPPPYVRIQIANGFLNVSQEITSEDTNSVKTIPIEMVDDANHRTQLLFNATQISTPSKAKFVVAEPNSYVRHIYNVENYETLLSCYNSGNCAALSLDAFTNAFNDLCWALMSNQLVENNSTTLNYERTKWFKIFQELGSHRDAVRDADCACCMQRRSNARAQCRWTWRDKCSKISLLKEE